jgi:MarR family transcriptional regulator for hemolysin
MQAMPPTLGFVLHDVARLLRKRFEQQSAKLKLTRSQWQVLAYVAYNPGIQQSALADILEVQPITLGRLLDKLQANGMVERQPHPTDRRIWLLYPTDAASPMLKTMTQIGQESRADALAGIPEIERERLMTLLSQMRTNLINACDGLGVEDAPAQRKGGVNV